MLRINQRNQQRLQPIQLHVLPISGVELEVRVCHGGPQFQPMGPSPPDTASVDASDAMLLCRVFVHQKRGKRVKGMNMGTMHTTPKVETSLAKHKSCNQIR